VSIRDQIALLEELASLDNEVRRIDEQLDKQRGSLEGMRSDLKTLEERLQADRDSLASLDKTRGELNVELRQMTQQIERSREKLQRSRNERESNAAQREMEELRKLHRDREDEIERLTASSDSLRAAIEQAGTKQRDLSQTLDGTAPGTTASLAELETEKSSRMESRKQLITKLPAALYRRYESIRTRRPMAIAKTHDGTCLGCHMSVPPMMFQKMLRQEEFEQCPNCRRILYYVPAPPAAGRESVGSGTPTADPTRA
jgi:predicted  nucleic acid-binding Zn-ribbon protein